jgi:hypothetical protein
MAICDTHVKRPNPSLRSPLGRSCTRLRGGQFLAASLSCTQLRNGLRFYHCPFLVAALPQDRRIRAHWSPESRLNQKLLTPLRR